MPPLVINGQFETLSYAICQIKRGCRVYVDKGVTSLVPWLQNGGSQKAVSRGSTIYLDRDVEFELWLEFEEWVDRQRHDPYDDTFNALVRLPDGSEYALTVWTFRTMWRELSKVLGSNVINQRYFVPPDLVIEKLDRSLMVAVVREMLEHSQLDEDWRVKEPHQEGRE